MKLNKQIHAGLMLGVILVLALAVGLAGCSAVPGEPVHVVIDNASEIGGVVFDQPVTVQDEDGTRAALQSNANETGFGDLQVAGYLDVRDTLYVGDWTHIFAQTAISVTDGAVITPTGTYQPLTSAGSVTATLTTSSDYVTAGDLLVLINANDTVTSTVNIVDSGTAKLTAAAALGQYDSLTLWFDGTNWIELSRADN